MDDNTSDPTLCASPTASPDLTQQIPSLSHIQPYIDEYDELSQLFLQHHYPLVWVGAQQLLIKLFRLPSPLKSGHLSMVEAFYITYSPLFPNVNDHLPDDLVVTHHLWANCWSLLLTLIGKGFSFGDEEVQDEELMTLDSPFQSNDFVKFEIGIESLQPNLRSFWDRLSWAYGPSLKTLPADIMLGVILVAVQNHQLEFAAELASNWFNSMPELWKQHLADVAIEGGWDESVTPQAKFYQLYDSILTLYLTHVLVGLGRWEDINRLLTKDSVLVDERKAILKDIVDQARQDVELIRRSQYKPTTLSSLATSLISPAQNNRNNSVSSSSHKPKSSNEVSKPTTMLSAWLDYFKQAELPALSTISGSFAFILLAFWLIRKAKTQGSEKGKGNFSWLGYWVYRMYQSIKPGLPTLSHPGSS